jgi:hypothetical protein
MRPFILSLCHSAPSLVSKLLFLMTLLAVPQWGYAQTSAVLWRDDFDKLDQNRWTVYDSGYAYGRTQFGNVPEIVAESAEGTPETRFARLKLSTNNNNTNYPLKGTEMYSPALMLESGKEIVAKVRSSTSRRGIVSAFWTYGSQGRYGTRTYSHDEIDFEFLSNWTSDRLLLTTWNDWSERYGYGDGVHHGDADLNLSGLDRSQWNIYKIRWLNDRVEWFVNDMLVPVYSTSAPNNNDPLPHPNDPMTVRFNIWAPDSSWQDAYDATLVGTNNPDDNHYLDVDWVEVRAVGSAPGENVSGDGLRGEYFNNKSLSGAAVLAGIDRQINFNWGSGSPAVGVNADSFSARWTGQIQAKYTETYSFYTRTSDGVRLWVNNQLIIDKWRNQNATEYRGTINLTAGKKYDIKMEYYENTGDAIAQLSWGSRSTLREVIPQSQLYSSATTASTMTRQVTLTSTPTITSNGVSVASANARMQTINLSFTSALDATTAVDAAHYQVGVDGVVVPVERVTYKTSTHTVTLHLPRGSMYSGSQVRVKWVGLVNKQGRSVTDAIWQGSVE